MAEVILTPEQQAVVENRGGALLVSAAAGSGKTKVLVDRLLSYVLDKEHPANIDDFLIITYTTAAAAELRTKIAAALTSALAAQPENRHLQRQLTRVYLAQISTVHAFCTSVLKKYAHLLDIPADFAVMEEMESDELRTRVMEEMLDARYADAENDPAFRAVIDELAFGRDDRRIGALVDQVYQASQCRVSPDDWLQSCLKSYDLADTAMEQTVWGQYFIARLKKTLRAALEDLTDCAKQMEKDEVLTAKYVPTFLENADRCRELMQQETWNGIFAFGTMDFGRIATVRDCGEPALKEYAQALRKRHLEAIRSAQKPFYADGEAVLHDLLATRPALEGLLSLVQDFAGRFRTEKLRRKKLDFSDLEHETIRLLGAPDAPSEAAEELADQFREILVDEYQDSNAVQERIFHAISREGRNLFLVGDVKQSIYRFRLAEPELFLKKYDTYPAADHAEAGEPRKILLSRNFRSRAEILHAVNDVFSLVMSREAGELQYGADEMLYHGRDYPAEPSAKVELHCIDLDIETGEDEADAKKAAEEAAFAADRIAAMLSDGTPVTDGDTLRPVRPEDIAILLRSPGNVAAYYQQALSDRGIPAVCDRGGNLLESTEAAAFMALLAVVENPHQDIPLSTVLLSPAFAVPPETLGRARGGMRRCDLYDCLRAYAPRDEKLTGFFSWLDAMRPKRGVLSLSALVEEILQTTTLGEVFSSMDDGAQRRRNLMQLREMAIDYEQQESRSVAQFLRYLEEQKEKGIRPRAASGAAGAVQIMSIHRSKGLEFPVVFLCDLTHRFNLTDNAAAVQLDDRLMIGCHVLDKDTKTRYPTAAHTAITARRAEKDVAEEMRVLYVAMTRAKERLIMTCCSKNLDATLKKWNGCLTDPVKPDVAADAKSLGDWILMAALCRTESGALFGVAGPSRCAAVRDDPWDVHRYSAAALRAGRGELSGSLQVCSAVCDRKEMETACGYRYPHSAAAALPSKLTATELKGREIDLEAAEAAERRLQPHERTWRHPSFDRDSPLTGREKGSATHLFMQFARYDLCTTEQGIRQELARLTAEEYLTPRQAEAVRQDAVLRLFTSDFGKKILAADDLKREFKFSVLSDAGEIDKAAAGEQIMLQGVVDCFWIERDGLMIVDYKNDRISGDLAEKTAQYRPQLTAYGKALSEIFGVPVKACWLWFFDADTAVRI